MFLFNEAKSKGVVFIMASASSLVIEGNRVARLQATSADGDIIHFDCDNVVIAAGPWTGRLSTALHLEHIPVDSLGGYSIVLRPSIPAGAECLFAELRTDRGIYQPELYVRSSEEIYICGSNADLLLPETPEDAVPTQEAIE